VKSPFLLHFLKLLPQARCQAAFIASHPPRNHPYSLLSLKEYLGIYAKATARDANRTGELSIRYRTTCQHIVPACDWLETPHYQGNSREQVACYFTHSCVPTDLKRDKHFGRAVAHQRGTISFRVATRQAPGCPVLHNHEWMFWCVEDDRASPGHLSGHCRFLSLQAIISLLRSSPLGCTTWASRW
jgi:hypothetical protein